MATGLADSRMAQQQHYVPANRGGQNDPAGRMPARSDAVNGDNIPYYYNQFDGLPVAYTAPSELKERMDLKHSIRMAAGKENIGSNVMRVDPIDEGEVAFLKSMKDQAELAEFDDYAETFINPRQPGGMQQMYQVYPDYINRRLQQAHTDYEFAMRNQMIDSWGINTFEDLHFKYLVDQGKLTGPQLVHKSQPVDASYAAGVLSPWAFRHTQGSEMKLPFSSAAIGQRPPEGNSWTLDRQNRPLGNSNSQQAMATAMYGGPTATERRAGGGGRSGLFRPRQRPPAATGTGDMD
jgi:hypothetical protein